jgi:hypothetical protein
MLLLGKAQRRVERYDKENCFRLSSTKLNGHVSFEIRWCLFYKSSTMDDSMDEEPSRISTTSYYPAHTNGPRPIPPSFSRADSSFSYPVRLHPSAHSTPRHEESHDASGFQDEADHIEEERPEEEHDEQDHEEDEAGEEGEEMGGSETSSVMFDAEADPEGFAKRLDELAGVLEKSEEEVRALKWGPPIGRCVKGELSIARRLDCSYQGGN